MKIVAGNIERLIVRLASHGCNFKIYPDGTAFATWGLYAGPRSGWIEVKTEQWKTANQYRVAAALPPIPNGAPWRAPF
jgi:hypothetical protein